MKRLVLVSGYSGAGKTVALRALEDAGYEAVDNIPLKVGASLVDALEDAPLLAIGSDVRSRGFSLNEFTELVAMLKRRADRATQLLFLIADPDVLLGRFKETRRPHPLASDRPLTDGIQAEVSLLYPLRALADVVLDTTGLNPRDLQREIQRLFSPSAPPFHLEILSFSYKFGVPRAADVVFDVRFLRNPHYDEALRPLTGQDAAVGKYILEDPRFSEVAEHLEKLLHLTIPYYRDEGKRLLTVAFGCTGGRHRSVFMAERMAECLAREGVSVSVRHREMQRA